MQTLTDTQAKVVGLVGWVAQTLEGQFLSLDQALDVAIGRLSSDTERNMLYTYLLERKDTYAIAAKYLTDKWLGEQIGQFTRIQLLVLRAELRKVLANIDKLIGEIPVYVEVTDANVKPKDFARYKVASARDGSLTATRGASIVGKGRSVGSDYRPCEFTPYYKVGRDRKVVGRLTAESGKWVCEYIDGLLPVSVRYISDTARKAVLYGWVEFCIALHAKGIPKEELSGVEDWDKRIPVNLNVNRDVFGFKPDTSELKPGAYFRYLDDAE